jgi:hypothetical protein
MKELINTVEKIWCETMHERVMWPIHGRYLCSTCLREYPVAFHDAETQSHKTTPLSDLSVSVPLRPWTASANR